MAVYGNLILNENLSLLSIVSEAANFDQIFTNEMNTIVVSESFSFSTIIDKIKELWEKFKKWFKETVKVLKGKINKLIKQAIEVFKKKVDKNKVESEYFSKEKNKTISEKTTLDYYYFDSNEILLNKTFIVLDAHFMYSYDKFQYEYSKIIKKDYSTRDEYHKALDELFENIDKKCLGSFEKCLNRKIKLKKVDESISLNNIFSKSIFQLQMDIIQHISENFTKYIINIQKDLDEIDKLIKYNDNMLTELINEYKRYQTKKESEEQYNKWYSSPDIKADMIKIYSIKIKAIQNDISRFKTIIIEYINSCYEITSALQHNKSIFLKLYGLYNSESYA